MPIHCAATLTQLNSHTKGRWLDETTEPPGLAHGGMHVVNLSGKPQDRPSPTAGECDLARPLGCSTEPHLSCARLTTG